MSLTSGCSDHLAPCRLPADMHLSWSLPTQPASRGSAALYCGCGGGASSSSQALHKRHTSHSAQHGSMGLLAAAVALPAAEMMPGYRAA